MGYLGYQKPQILGGKVYDGSKSLGTNGQVLSTNGSTGVSWATLGNGTLTLGVAGQGITFTGGSTFTANQTTNTSFTVTLNASHTNTADALVIRDGLGDFAARNITATFFDGVVDRTNKLVINSTNTSITQYPVFVDSISGNKLPKVDSNLQYNPATNTLTTTTFSGSLSGTATRATYLGTTASSSNTNYHILFGSSYWTDSNNQIYTESQGNFIYNPSTNRLTVGGSIYASTFVGSVSGNVTGNLQGVADDANQIRIQGISSNGTYLVTFVGGTGYQDLYVDNGTPVTYNPATNTLSAATITATTFGGNLIGDVTGDLTGTADEADAVKITAQSFNSSNLYVPFLSGSTYSSIYYDSAFYYNASSNQLNVGYITASNTITANAFSGNLTGNVTGNLTGIATKATTVQITTNGLNSTHYLVFSGYTSGYRDLYVDNNSQLTYNPSANVLTTGRFVGAHQGTVYIQTSSANSNFYIPFVNAPTGDRDLFTDTGIYYNPSTNTLYTSYVQATTFTGNLTGTASVATRAQTIDQNFTTSNINYSVLFGDQSSGTSKTVYVNNSKIYFNPSTGRLTATEFAGDVVGNVTSSDQVYSSLSSVNQQRYFAFHGPGTTSGIKDLEFNTTIYCNPSQSAIYATRFYGRATVADDADRSDTSNVALSSASSVHYLSLVTGSGDQQIYRSADLWINPNTRSFHLDGSNARLNCATFVGDLEGNADTASQAYINYTNSSTYRYLVGQSFTSNGNRDLYSYNTIYANFYTGRLYASVFEGTLVGTATNTQQVQITTDNSYSSRYITFTANTTGNQLLYGDTGLTFVSATNTLTTTNAVVTSELTVGNMQFNHSTNWITGVTRIESTNFIGALTGNASSASLIDVGSGGTNSNNCMVLFVEGVNNQEVLSDPTFYYAPSSDTLSANNISCSNITASGTITGDVTGDLTGNASSADTVTFTELSTDTTCYVAFSDVTSGQSDVNINTTQLTFNPNYGNLVVGGTVTTNSDRKLKTNIETIDKGLDKVMAMRGVKYLRKDTNETQIGVIAQEVEEVIPEVVYGDETKSVSYGNIVAVLIEAIKEQNKRIDDLEFMLAGGNGGQV